MFPDAHRGNVTVGRGRAERVRRLLAAGSEHEPVAGGCVLPTRAARGPCRGRQRSPGVRLRRRSPARRRAARIDAWGPGLCGRTPGARYRRSRPRRAGQAAARGRIRARPRRWRLASSRPEPREGPAGRQRSPACASEKTVGAASVRSARSPGAGCAPQPTRAAHMPAASRIGPNGMAVLQADATGRQQRHQHERAADRGDQEPGDELHDAGHQAQRDGQLHVARPQAAAQHGARAQQQGRCAKAGARRHSRAPGPSSPAAGPSPPPPGPGRGG